jgi:hypothetical protein
MPRTPRLSFEDLSFLQECISPTSKDVCRQNLDIDLRAIQSIMEFLGAKETNLKICTLYDRHVNVTLRTCVSLNCIMHHSSCTLKKNSATRSLPKRHTWYDTPLFDNSIFKMGVSFHPTAKLLQPVRHLMTSLSLCGAIYGMYELFSSLYSLNAIANGELISFLAQPLDQDYIIQLLPTSIISVILLKDSQDNNLMGVFRWAEKYGYQITKKLPYVYILLHPNSRSVQVTLTNEKNGWDVIKHHVGYCCAFMKDFHNIHFTPKALNDWIHNTATCDLTVPFEVMIKCMAKKLTLDQSSFHRLMSRFPDGSIYEQLDRATFDFATYGSKWKLKRYGLVLQ